MPDYSKGKIYKLCSDDPDITDVYIGSTVQVLNERWLKHKSDVRLGIKNCSSFEMLTRYGIDNFHIELLEDYSCGSLKELCIREQHYLDTTDCVNEFKAYRSVAEEKIYKLKWAKENNYDAKYYQANKDKSKKRQADYQKNNSEKITCECGKIIMKYCMKSHLTTKTHATLMEALQQQAQPCP